MRWRQAFTGALAAAVLAAACGGADTSTTSTTTAPGAVIVDQAVQPELPDLAAESYVDNLLAKEKDGEWTRGEGLVATLELVFGESRAEDVLRHPELEDYELTGIVAMGREYIDSGDDDAARARIVDLLDRLIPSNERLEAMAGIGPETASLSDAVTPVAFQQAVEDCKRFFPVYPQDGVGPCLVAEALTVPDVPGPGPYRVFRPADDMPDAGWTKAHFERARDAMFDTVVAFSQLDGIPKLRIPPINLVFSVVSGGNALAAADPEAGRPCGVVIFTGMKDYKQFDFEQVVAHEVAHCFQTENFVPQNQVPYPIIRWREEGMAEYLSALVYDDNDLEWDVDRMANLAQNELATTLFDRSYSNFVFFMYLASRGGNPLVFDVVRSLPTTAGDQAQREALRTYPGMLQLHQDFATTATDERLPDTLNPGFGPFPMTDANRPTKTIATTGTVLQAWLRPFGLQRARLVVPPGKQACLQWDDSEVFAEYRPNPSGDWQELPVILPPAVEDSGDVDVVFTAKTAHPFALNVLSVHDFDEDTDGELVGEWVVINGSLRPTVEYIAPVQDVSSISGSIRVVFRSDETVKISYESFRVTGASTVELEQGAFSTNYSQKWESITDAVGEDTYELSGGGDFLFYGNVFEKDILQGNQTILTSASGLFFGIDAGELELEVDIPESTEDVQPATGWGFLGGADKVRFACGGNILMLDDVALRRVP